MYREFKTLELAKIGEEILNFWKAEMIFEKSISTRSKAKPFTFYEGPPSANGMPGIHHVMARAIKDIFCRYKTLKGYQVKRKGGWDTHGLPIELAVEKKLGITKDGIGKKISVEEYNSACKEEVMRYTNVWNDLTEKMGYWVDLEKPYVTYHNEYIETLWWILKSFYEKGLLYKGYTVQPYSPAAGTGLSSHELNQPGTYRDVSDTTIVAQFKVLTPALSKGEGANTLAKAFNSPLSEGSGENYFLAWTTTPWTLPSNTALTVGPKIDYVLVKTFNQYTFEPIQVILAKALVGKQFAGKYFLAEADEDFINYKAEDKKIPYQILAECKGEALVGIKYEQLLPYALPYQNAENAFRVIAGDFVTTEDGTGIVHTAPTFGADDARVAKMATPEVPPMLVLDNKGNAVPLVDLQGKFIAALGGNYGGKYVKNEYYIDGDAPEKSVDVEIAIQLKEENKAFKVEKYVHTYPHCWRTDKPVLYYPLDSWFIKTTAVKEKMVELNKTINWKPEATGTGRFGNWLENLVDWNLSRSRYWGTPLPIWRTLFIGNGIDQDIVIGSIEDLNAQGKYFKFDSAKEYFRSNTLDYIFQDLGFYIDDSGTFIEEHAILSQIKDDIETISLSHFLTFCPNEDKIYNMFSLPIDQFFEEKGIPFDLHRPYIDNVILTKTADNGKKVFYTRESDLIDVWFDSGAMPYAQWHFPFENKEEFENAYPADFIAEGVDQTRGWFFTLHAIAVMLNESSDEIKAINKQVNNLGVAYKNVVSNGLVLDKNGNKMSKRLGNAVDPFSTIATYSADATRWYMISNASPWDNLKFNLEGLDEVRRKFFGTLYNTYSFFALYANIDKFEIDLENQTPIAQRSELDRWILSLLQTLIKEVDESYEAYEPTKATRAIQTFVDEHLSNWYIRLSRRRFWKGEMTADKKAAYETLFTCLMSVSQIMSPVAPFFADWLYIRLTEANPEVHTAKSVHLTIWNEVDETLIDYDLNERMELAQNISSMVLSLRKKMGINVRQPLAKVLIPVLDDNFQVKVELVKDLILSETNIKEVDFIKDTAGFIKKKIKPNFKALGAKVGKDMKLVTEAINNISQEDLAKFERDGSILIPDTSYSILLSDVEIIAEDIPGWQVTNMGNLTVALDVTITTALKQEGLSRELINRIQNLRKELNFEVTDRITVKLQQDNLITPAVMQNKAYICAEILANDIVLTTELTNGNKIVIEDVELEILIAKQ